MPGPSLPMDRFAKDRALIAGLVVPLRLTS